MKSCCFLAFAKVFVKFSFSAMCMATTVHYIEGERLCLGLIDYDWSHRKSRSTAGWKQSFSPPWFDAFRDTTDCTSSTFCECEKASPYTPCGRTQVKSPALKSEAIHTSPGAFFDDHWNQWRGQASFPWELRVHSALPAFVWPCVLLVFCFVCPSVCLNLPIK